MLLLFKKQYELVLYLINCTVKQIYTSFTYSSQVRHEEKYVLCQTIGNMKKILYIHPGNYMNVT